MRKIAWLMTTLWICLMAAPCWGALPPSAVADVWKKLTAAAPLENPGEPQIVSDDKNGPNAWVSFSGNQYRVFVTKSLLFLLESEDELAGVLGHEIGHIKLGHYDETNKHNFLLTLLYGALGQTNIPPSLISTGLSLVEAGFSREQEVEADDYGVYLSAKAGFSPYGLLHAMERLQKAGYKTAPSGFNSHPPTDRRLEHIKNTADSVAQQMGKTGS